MIITLIYTARCSDYSLGPIPVECQLKQGDELLMTKDVVCRDGRLKRGDELLMINGQSLVGLTHQEAVDSLRSAPSLVQLVVASKVS